MTAKIINLEDAIRRKFAERAAWLFSQMTFEQIARAVKGLKIITRR